jgi:hypothetical protein
MCNSKSRKQSKKEQNLKVEACAMLITGVLVCQTFLHSTKKSDHLYQLMNFVFTFAKTKFIHLLLDKCFIFSLALLSLV